MYESFFGLRARPFSLVPDPNFLYLSRHHRNGLKMLEHSLREQASFTLISGEVGTGKTVMVRKFLQLLPSSTSVGLVTNTHESIGSLIEWILLSFGLDYRGRDKIELYDILNQYLQDQRRNNRPSLLIIDEAQNLSISALEELRMLSNVNEDKNLILQIILVGQLEILEKLNRPDLRQLAQ